jgi:hypothetical protein
MENPKLDFFLRYYLGCYFWIIVCAFVFRYFNRIETMKPYIYITLSWLLLVYLGTAFIYAELNPFNLAKETRGGMVFVAFFGGIIANLLWLMIEDDARKTSTFKKIYKSFDE